MRVLLDNDVPAGIRQCLVPRHEVVTAANQGWHQLRNGDLLKAAEAAGFDVMITADQNMAYQQNLKERKTALIVLGANRWPYVQKHLPAIASEVDNARPNGFTFVEILLPSKPTYKISDD